MRRFNQTIAIAIMAMLFCTTRAWADVKQSDSTKVVSYSVGNNKAGFNIKFKYNERWRKTTFDDGGYATYISFDNGASKKLINGEDAFVFGKKYTIDDKIEVTIEASIPDSTSSTVSIQYKVKNKTNSPVSIKLGSCADTQVGENDGATVYIEENELHQKYIVMEDNKSSSPTYGAKYKISAGLGDLAFTSMWYGDYCDEQGYFYTEHVFDKSTGTYGGSDSALAWSWDITIPAGTTVYRFAGGGEHVMSAQSGTVSMDNYTYGETPSTPTVSNIASVSAGETPVIIYYYNTSNSNIGGTAWSADITGTTLNAGTYYMYAQLNSTENFDTYTTDPVAFEVEKAPLTVTANDHSITYGDAPAANDVTYSGFVDNQTSSVLGGTLGYDYNYARYGNVGDNYTITPKGLTATNYQITYASGKLTVNPRALTVTPDAEQSKTYGETDPALTYSAPELVNGDVLSGAMSRAEGENVGTYAINKGTLANSNYSMTFTSGVEFTIKAKTVTEPTITLGTTSYTYDGTEKKPTVTVKDGETTIPASEYTVSYEDNINVGTATVKITDKDGGNYTVSGSTTFAIAAADGSLTPPTAKTGLVYTGSPMDLITAGSSTTGTVQYSLDGSTYSATIPQGEEAKEYTVYYKVVANSGYKDVAAQSFKVTIAPKTVTSPTITLGTTSYTYDGTEKKPDVTSVKDGDTTIPSEEYTVSYEDNINVGTATVKITDKDGGNYTVSGSTTFAIAAADGSLTPPTAKTDLVYTGSPMDLITAGSSTTGTVQYSLDGSTYNTTIPQGEEAKEYTVYYKVVANSGYKDVAAQSFKVTIAPKTVTEPTITLSESSYIFDDKAKEPSVTVKDCDTTIPTSEYTVSYEDNVKVGTATVKITDVEGGNYIVNGSATFSITQDMQTVEVETEEDKTVKTDIAATITDEENKEVTITDADIPASEVGSTEAAIPPTVEIGGETYTVTEIADNAFAGKSEITDIYLPDTEEPITIGVDALKISDTEIARVHTPLALLDDYALDKELEQHVEADKLMATVTPPNQYWTFSCGIDVKVPEGVKVYKCILNEEGTAVIIIEISEADLGGIIKANNGVLLSSTAGNPYDIIASKNDDITTIADRDEKSYGRDNLLEPVIESANYAADEYYVLYNNEFRAIISNNSKVPACKAVLHKPAGVSASRSLDIDEDETTGIRHFYAFPDSDGDWYDIKGQRVDRPAQRGVYIQKGKKIIIK